MPLPMVAQRMQHGQHVPLPVLAQRQQPAAVSAELPPAVQLRNALRDYGSAASARELDERPFPSSATESTFSLRDAETAQADETFVPAREVVDPRPVLRSVASRRERTAELVVPLPKEDAVCEAEVVHAELPARARRMFDERSDDSTRASRIARRIALRYPNALQPC